MILFKFSCNCSNEPGMVGTTGVPVPLGKGSFRSIRHEDQIHHQLAGQQVAALQLGPEALLFDQHLHQGLGIIARASSALFLLVNDADSFRFHGDDDRNLKFLRVGIEFQIEVDNLADLDAIEFYRGTDTEPPHRLDQTGASSTLRTAEYFFSWMSARSA